MKRGYFHFSLGIAFLLSACNESPSRAPSVVNYQTGAIPAIQSATPSPTPRRSATPAPTPVETPRPTPRPSSSGPSLAALFGISVDQDLRRFDSPVVHQFGGTCSTFATAAAINNVLKSKGLTEEVSEQHLWSTYRTYNYTDAVNAASNNFLTPEEYWSIDGTQSPDYLSHASIRITHSHDYQDKMDEALRSLSAGHPLVMAIQVPRDLFNCEKDIGEDSARTHGAHVVAVVGYHLDDQVAGGGYFILKNSWGPDCGENGYQHYPFALCKRTDLYCYFISIDDAEVRTPGTSVSEK